MLALLKGRWWLSTAAPDMTNLVSNHLPVSKWHSRPLSLGLWIPEGSQELREQRCFSTAPLAQSAGSRALNVCKQSQL